MLGNPTACPHGNPMPGSAHHNMLLTPLNTIEIGDSFTVVRISEELEETAGALDTLEANKMFPGKVGTISNRSNDGAVSVTMSDSAQSAPTAIDSFISSRLLVSTKK
ncbi:MAG: hypothetical protein ACO3A0_02195 [Ilumatobacteraceae bacterium]|jgi:DtxR family Mn-dependent transcriptional regulator